MPTAFVMGALPLIWREQGYTLLQIGVLQALYLPWVFKALWAPIVDRWSKYGGAQFYFLLLAQVSVSFLCLTLAALPPGPDPIPTFAVILLLSIVSATADNAGDTVAIRLTPKSDSERANSWREAAALFSAAISAGGGLIIAMNFGWSIAIFLIATLSTSGIVATVWLKRKIISFKPSYFLQTRFESSLLLGSFLRPRGLQMFGIIALASAANRAAGANPRILLSDLNLSAECLGFVFGVLEPGTGVAGAITFGVLARSMGVLRLLPVAIGLKALVLFTFAGALRLTLEPEVFVALYLSIIFCFGAIVASFGGLILRWSRTGSEATDAASFFSVAAVMWFVMQPLSGYVADTYNYVGLFIACALIATFASLTLPRMLGATIIAMSPSTK